MFSYISTDVDIFGVAGVLDPKAFGVAGTERCCGCSNFYNDDVRIIVLISDQANSWQCWCFALGADTSGGMFGLSTLCWQYCSIMGDGSQQPACVYMALLYAMSHNGNCSLPRKGARTTASETKPPPTFLLGQKAPKHKTRQETKTLSRSSVTNGAKFHCNLQIAMHNPD